jgi:pimeloyl-ACP methyl ester carboxylesterase
MSTFALIHGSCHGAWCWALLSEELTRRGHTAIAVDLPIENRSAGALHYARAVDRALGAHDDVIVVGHSLGGLVVPVVASLRAVRHMVFLAGLVPRPRTRFADLLAVAPWSLLEQNASDVVDARGMFGPRSFALAQASYYNDVSLEVALWAWRQLRPQSMRPILEMSPLDVWPSVASSSIVMADDRAVDVSYSRAAASTLLGVVPIELPGGHSPFLSRPGALADELAAIANEG